MRPGHIRVFDGLRITTEHMNHLQDSFHSALQDIREILGLGRVYCGFEVVPEAGNAIVVQPGLAFDFQKNRIICDEPKKVEVTFEPGEEVKYVCLKYAQVEQGQVEGQFTMIWDSCSVLLRTSQPEDQENLVPIAKLVRPTDGNGAFEIVRLVRPEQAGAPRVEAAAALESGEAVETPAPAATEGMEVEAGAQPRGPQPGLRRTRIEQGIVRLDGSSSLNSVVLEDVKKLASGGNASGRAELLFVLAQREVPLNFSLLGLTCHTIVSVSFDLDENHEAAREPGAEAPAAPYSLKFQSSAAGEVAFADAGVSQFGLSNMQCCLISKSGAQPAWAPELSEREIARLTFGALPVPAVNEKLAGLLEVLGHLKFLVRAEATASPGFKIACSLSWTGEAGAGVVEKIGTKRIGFAWETVVAWKALGESPA